MSETNAILEARRRARDYWDIDGLPALLEGTTTVLLGVLWLPTDNHLPWWWDTCLTLGLVALLFLSDSKKTLEWLKSRITYPRTGYVAPPKETPYSKRDPYTIISITKEPAALEPEAPLEGRASRKALDFPWPLLLLLWWFFSFDGWLASLACLATALWFWWRNKKDPPWFEIAGATIAGLLSAILTVSDRSRFCIVLIVFGASSMAKGATLLIRYLLQHPAPRA
jgi:hypothetical protein